MRQQLATGDSAPQKPRDFLTSPAKFDLKLIGSLQPDSKPLKAILGVAAKPSSILILIGPEGDFTPAELGLAKSAGCLPLSLGPLVLRAEPPRFTRSASSTTSYKLPPSGCTDSGKAGRPRLGPRLR